MLKGVIKFNGLIVAGSCIFYAVMSSLSEESEEKLEKSIFGKLTRLIVDESKKQDTDHTVYFALIAASLILIGGIFLERKRLLIPFVAASLWTYKHETKGKFQVTFHRQALFIYYVGISIVLLVLVIKPFSSCEDSKCCWCCWCCRSNVEEADRNKLKIVVVKK